MMEISTLAYDMKLVDDNARYPASFDTWCYRAYFYQTISGVSWVFTVNIVPQLSIKSLMQ